MTSEQLLHDYVFHFNAYTEKWSATTRDHYHELFSGDKGNTISSSSVNTLVSLIKKYRGDIKKIKALA
jgi:hypothetical protein